jgi:hypothetical protein
MTSRKIISLLFCTWEDKCSFFNRGGFNNVKATFVERVSLSKEEERRESCGGWYLVSE